MNKDGKIQIRVKALNGFSETIYVLSGQTLEEILLQSNIPEKKEIIAAVMNNQYADMSERVLSDMEVDFISIREDRGLEIYRHTATHILNYVIITLFGRNILHIGPSIQYNYYFDLGDERKMSKSLLRKIKKEFDSIVKSNERIEKVLMPLKEALKYYESMGDRNKLELLSGLKTDLVKCYRIENYREFCHGPLAVSTGIISKYKFIFYFPGFILEFPKVKKNKFKVFSIKKPRKLSKIFMETREWYKTQGVSGVEQLNSLVKKERSAEIINVSEALHEKRISQIADEITKHKGDIKLVLIAGPSASGKTTFIKRLNIQLKVNGIMPEAISLDNYFVSREITPLDENGNYDFECLEALDLGLLNEHLAGLLKGKTIPMPQFDFHTGRRKKETVPMRLEKDQIILIEGIHGLNDKLTFSVAKKKKFKVYVSALSQLRIDNDHRITTTDTRLFRRIVRDYLFRGHSAHDTLKMWPMVRKGEEKYIFPFQEDADIMFNSALIYEGAVLKPFARKYLEEVPAHVPEYAEARRLLGILDYFTEYPAANIPKVSIVKEFIGDSVFEY
ncbi:MAG: nucleoside kinase [bacterium]|nr:nucleoside kinase [bacterium]